MIIDGKYINNEWTVRITPSKGEPYEIKLDTEDIDWSMDQYQRNREPLTYELFFKC